MENGLTHFDAAGKAAMVDVSQKEETLRLAVAGGCIRMNAAAFSALQQGTVQKGDVLGVARVAGIMAAKQTSSLIPLCHPVATEKVALDFILHEQDCRLEVRCSAQATGKTGVEMEALTGATLALLTVYDMCKALDKAMVMDSICLLEKQGGKSGGYHFTPDESGKSE